MNVLEMRPLAETETSVTLSRAHYEALLEAAEDAADAATLEAAADAEARLGKDSYRANALPVELVERLLAGENAVRIWRQHRAMTMAELARKAGVAQGYLSEIESGKKPGSFDTMAKIAKALRISLDDLAA